MINILNKIYLGKKLFILLILTFHSLSLREDGRNSGQEPGCKDHEGMLLVGLLLKARWACFFIHCRISNQENVPQTCPQSNLTETIFPLKFSLPSWNWCVSNLTRLSASNPGIQFLNSFYQWLWGAMWVLGLNQTHTNAASSLNQRQTSYLNTEIWLHSSHVKTSFKY